MTDHPLEHKFLAGAVQKGPCSIDITQLGELSAFNEMIRAYQDVVYRQAYWILGQADAAEDATQEAFLRAYQSLPLFRGGSFRSWILKITSNVCIDELRRQKRDRTVPLEPRNDCDEEMDCADWLVDPKKSPEKLIESSDTSSAIRRCIRQLPVDYQRVIILVDLQELSYLEAAAVLGVPAGTVKSRLARARLQFRAAFRGCDHFAVA